MKPDRTNYEIWFIDWLDGNLNGDQVELLKSFLDNNPDIKEEFETIRMIELRPDSKCSSGLKEKLKKSYSDLSQSCFDYLVIAGMENDLSAMQESEIKDIINLDPVRKNHYELLHKTKLIAPEILFPGKAKLKKITPVQRIIRRSFIGLSAAASIALLVVAFLFITGRITDKSGHPAQVAINDTVLMVSPPVIIERGPIGRDGISDNIPFSDDMSSVSTKPVIFSEIPVGSNSPDSSAYILLREGINISKITVSYDSRLFDGISKSDLIEHQPVTPFPAFKEDGRSNVERFLAKFFHEKIMKDTTSVDRPVKGYEIAEAGINGINRLFGWEMAFYKNTDDNGELRSIYFSSKILKFNTPIKKTVPAL